jgi:hypothetical protein
MSGRPSAAEKRFFPSHYEVDSRGERLTAEVTDVIDVAPGSVELFGAGNDDTRYIYGFTDSPDQLPGFVKVVNAEGDELNNERLRREVAGVRAATAVGAPAVRVLSDYARTQSGRGVIHLERLDLAEGIMYMTNEQGAMALPAHGRTMARAILTVSGQPIPEGVAVEGLDHNNWRSASFATFQADWDVAAATVLSDSYTELLAELVDPEWLRSIVEQSLTGIRPFITQTETAGQLYLVHNDATMNNVYIADEGSTRPTMMIDFESAGVSNTARVAQLSDLGTMYGRFWPNPPMQREFLAEVYHTISQDPQEAYCLTKAVAVAGAIDLSRYAMAPDHPEHTMAKALLSHLRQNLALVDEYHT